MPELGFRTIFFDMPELGFRTILFDILKTFQ